WVGVGACVRAWAGVELQDVSFLSRAEHSLPAEEERGKKKRVVHRYRDSCSNGFTYYVFLRPVIPPSDEPTSSSFPSPARSPPSSSAIPFLNITPSFSY
ncbi:hypothetical protein L249_6977, partial [Ophiocordyceps polyrhachis-furcata BCC 54312]